MTNDLTLRRSVAYICFIVAACFLQPAYATDYKSGVTAKILKKSTVTGNGQKIVFPKTDKAEVTAMTVELAPGAETGWHKHPVPVYAYVLSGILSIELEDGTQLQYKADDAIIEVVDTFHNGKNNGTVPLNLAVFYLGAEGTPNVVKREIGDSSQHKH